MHKRAKDAFVKCLITFVDGLKRGHAMDPEADLEWNLNAVRALELWQLGYTGAGAVVGVSGEVILGGDAGRPGRGRPESE